MVVILKSCILLSSKWTDSAYFWTITAGLCALSVIPISFVSLTRIWQLGLCGFAHLSRDSLDAVFPEPGRPMSKILFAVIQPNKVRKIQQQGEFFSHYPERNWSLNSSRGSRTGRSLLVQQVKVSQNSWQNQESHSHMACELLIRTSPPSPNWPQTVWST